eukprot:Polyplicarium_translucidae@DN3018_c0_g1_i1.p1
MPDWCRPVDSCGSCLSISHCAWCESGSFCFAEALAVSCDNLLTDSCGGKVWQNWEIVLLTVGIVGGLILIAVAILFFRPRSKELPPPRPPVLDPEPVAPTPKPRPPRIKNMPSADDETRSSSDVLYHDGVPLRIADPSQFETARAAVGEDGVITVGIDTARAAGALTIRDSSKALPLDTARADVGGDTARAKGEAKEKAKKKSKAKKVAAK